jgi:diguanylate cyclase (GGDEF)-like protein
MPQRLAEWMRHSGKRSWFRYPILAISWLLLWRISVLMHYAPHASLWFPPAGLSFAALLVMGWRAVPVLMVCSIASTFWGADMYPLHAQWRELLRTGVYFGVAHCASYGIGAGVLRRIIRRTTMQSLPIIIIAFLAIGSLSALAAAFSGVQALEWSGMLDPDSAQGLWLPWWIGDMAGALVLTPMFLGLLSRGYPQIQSWFGGLNFRARENNVGGYVVKLLVSIFLLSTVMLAAAQFQRQEIAFAVFFLIIPQMWIVYTEAPFRSALSLAVFSTTMAVWAGALGITDQALTYQFAICVTAASAYFGLAVPVLVASNKQLSELAFSDGLTKVASKNHFFDRSEQELADARRFDLPVSLILLDVDRFKDINDTYGHAIGDQALVRLAMTVKMQLRQSDVFGRFGGDEFMLLLPGVDHDRAVATTERLHKLLQETDIPGTDRQLKASFGMVVIEPGETIMQAFKRADRLLLGVKRGGRNSIGIESVDAGPVSAANA